MKKVLSLYSNYGRLCARLPHHVTKCNFQVLRLESTTANSLEVGSSNNYSFNDSQDYKVLYPAIRKGKFTKEFTRQLICRSYDYEAEVVSQLQAEYPQLSNVQPQSFADISDYLKNVVKIDKNLLISHFWLHFETLSLVQKKFQLLAKLGAIDKDIILLYKLNLYTLKRVCAHWKVKDTNRFKYLESRIGCTMSQLVATSNLLICSFGLLESKLNFLLNTGFQPAEVCERILLLTYSEERLRNKVKEIKEADIGPLKLWMLSCTQEKYERMLSQWRGLGKSLENVTSVESYLQDRLECDEEYLKCLAFRFPPLLHLHVQQIKLVLDFVYSIGFTPKQVCLTPRILKHDVDELKSRYSQLTQLGCKAQHLYNLISNESNFSNLLKTLEKKQFA